MSHTKNSLTTRKLLIILSSVFVVLAAATVTLILIFPSSPDGSTNRRKSTANPEDVKYRVSPTDKFAPASYSKSSNNGDYTTKLANIKDPEVFQKIEGKLIKKCGKNYRLYIANAGLGDTISGNCYSEDFNGYDSYIYFAYRLSDGEDVQFNDLFIDPAKVYPFLTPSICFAQIGADMWKDAENSWSYPNDFSKRSCDEDILLRTIAEFTVDGIQPGQFYYTSDFISVTTANAGTISLNMQNMMDNIAIYKRFKSGSLDQNAYAAESMDVPQRFVFSTELTSANYISDFSDSTSQIYVMADISTLSYSNPNSAEVTFAKRQADQYIKDKKADIAKKQDASKTYLLAIGVEGSYADPEDGNIEIYLDGFIAEFSGDDTLAQIAATTYTFAMGGAYSFADWIKDGLDKKVIVSEDGYYVKYDKATKKDIRACKDVSGLTLDRYQPAFPGEEVIIYDYSTGYRVDIVYSIDANCHATKLY